VAQAAGDLRQLDERPVPRGCAGSIHTGRFRCHGEATQHLVQVLTKRSERLRELAASLPWSPNVWVGVTVEAAEYLRRVDDLAKCRQPSGFSRWSRCWGHCRRLACAGSIGS